MKNHLPCPVHQDLGRISLSWNNLACQVDAANIYFYEDVDDVGDVDSKSSVDNVPINIVRAWLSPVCVENV